MPTCPTRRSPRPRGGERGFALVLVFLMAAAIAISLYYEVPRVAMESQRQKEQLLIDRGEQYKRAIQLYYAKAKRYPAEIKDLESFQNTRFLRHRYIDPMTGKDEWRLIHVQNGVLTDSLVNKQGQKQQKEASTAGMFIGEQAGLGQTPTSAGGGGAANVRNRIRQSDGTVVNGPPNELTPGGVNPTGFPNAGVNAGMPPTGAVPGTTPGTPGNPQYPVATQFPGGNPNNPTGQPNYPGATTMPPGVPVPQGGVPGNYQVGVPGVQGGIPAGMPGSTAPGRGATGAPTGGGLVGGGSSFVGSTGSLVGGSPLVGTTPTTGTGNPTGFPGNTGQQFGQQFPGQQFPGQQQLPGQQLPGQPGAPVNSQFGGVSPQQYSTQPGANGVPPGFPQPGGTAGAPNNQAADLIRNILTTPRPGGMPTQAMGGQTIGGGLAGVASTSDGEGVKVYNDRTLYAEWEFIFDLSKIKQIPNPNAQGAVGTPASQLGNTQGMQQPGVPVTPGVNGINPGLQTPPGMFGAPGGRGR